MLSAVTGRMIAARILEKTTPTITATSAAKWTLPVSCRRTPISRKRWLTARSSAAMLSKGVTPMLGLRIQDLLPAEQADKIWEDERRIMREGRIETLEYEVDTSEGRRTFNSIKGPLRDETGTIGVFGMDRDITDMVTVRRQLQESERRYRLLFENNPQPMWVIDLETLEFLAVNDAAVAHYGYSRDEFLSMRLPVVAPPDLVNGLERIMEAKLKAPCVAHQVTGPWLHRLKDGRVIDVEITGRNIEFEGRPARIGLINDVTAKQRVELERDAAHRLLEDVLSRVTDAFVSAGNTGAQMAVSTVILRLHRVQSTVLQLQIHLPATRRPEGEARGRGVQHMCAMSVHLLTPAQ